VECMWLMLQQEQPDDYVIATGKTHSVRDFVSLAFAEVGVRLQWVGSGVEERGIDAATGETRVAIDPKYFRPAEVEFLWGDPSKAASKLGWQPKTSLEELVQIMVQYDLKYDEYGGGER